MSEGIKKKRNWLFITITVVALIFIIVGAIWWQKESALNKELNTARSYVTEVLNKKYGEKFAIDKAEYVWATGSYNFIAHPVNEPDFKFTAQLGHISQSGVTDQYLSQKRFFEVQKMISSFINEISPNNIVVCANLLYRNTTDEEFKTIIRKKLTASEILRNYPDKSGVYVEAYVALDITPQNEDQVLKNIYALITFLKDKKFGEIKIVIYFFDQNYFKDKSIKDEYKKYENYGGFAWRLRKLISKRLVIYPNDIEAIKSYVDLKKYYLTFNLGE